LLREIGGIEIGIGTLQATKARVADAVKPAVEDLWQWAPLQPHIHVDETPWCVKGIKEWLTDSHRSRFLPVSCCRHSPSLRIRNHAGA